MLGCRPATIQLDGTKITRIDVIEIINDRDVRQSIQDKGGARQLPVASRLKFRETVVEPRELDAIKGILASVSEKWTRLDGELAMLPRCTLVLFFEGGESQTVCVGDGIMLVSGYTASVTEDQCSTLVAISRDAYLRTLK